MYKYIYILLNKYVWFSATWPPLWSSRQSFWLQIQRSRVRFPALPDFLRSSGSGTRGPLSLVSTIEELLGRNISGFGLENREYGRGDPLRWPRDTLYPQKLELTLPTSCGRSAGVFRLLTEATEFVFCYIGTLYGDSVRGEALIVSRITSFQKENAFDSNSFRTLNIFHGPSVEIHCCVQCLNRPY
jgi:hypothetical protein